MRRVTTIPWPTKSGGGRPLLLLSGPAGGFWLILVACAFLPGAMSAQVLDPSRTGNEFVRESWGTRDGMPEGAVLGILETSDGYLWVGTESAMGRFDGHRFETIEPGVAGVPNYSFGRDLFEDPQGRIWSALAGGLGRFEGSTLEVLGRDRGLNHPFVYALAPGPEGSIWVGTGGSGVWKYAGGVFSRHPSYEELVLPGQVNDLLVGPNDALWLATDSGVVFLDEGGVRTVSLGLPSPVVNVLARSSDGRLWAGTRFGLAAIQGDAFVPLSDIKGDVTAMVEDPSGSLWVGTRDGGLFRVDGNRSVRLNRESDATAGGVFSLAVASEGGLWVGRHSGLERYREGPFLTLSTPRGFDHERMFNVVRRNEGGLWVLDAVGAVYVYDGGRANQIAPPGTIAGEGMLGMAEADDGSLWIGGQQLHRLVDGRVESYPSPAGGVAVIVSDGDRLLVATSGVDGRSSLAHIDEGRFIPVALDVSLRHVQRLLRARDGQLWISTGGGGLVRVGPEGSRVFTTRDGLPDDIVYGILEADDGSMWIATRSGLARIRGDRVQSLASIEGPPRRSPAHLQFDGRGRLWVSAHDGIHRMALTDLEAALDGHAERVPARVFSARDGLLTNVVSWRCAAQARTPDGRLWYATDRGLAVVDPAEVTTPSVPPRGEITEVWLAGRRAVHGNALSVGEGRERVEIHFTAPVLTRGDVVEFRYQLDGYDSDWIDVGTQRAAHYTNPPPGKYRFLVAGRFPGGEWGPEAVLSLAIEPKWYETLIARVLFALALLGVAWGLHAARVRHHMRREQLLLERVDERTGELAREVGERRRAEESVRLLNEELEVKVSDRTAQLSEVNRALAADVADRRRAEAALAEEKERLAVTLASLGEGVITTDVEARVASLNAVAEELLEWSSNDAVGRRVDEVFLTLRSTDGQPLADLVLKALAEGKRLELPAPTTFVGRGGREVVVEASAAPIHDRERDVIGVVLVVRDVTVRARTEEQLRHTQKLEAVGLLAGGIAHDFNNLLTGILGHIDLARSSLPAQSTATRRLAETVEVLDNARGLARQLLTFSAGGQPSVKPRSLGELLHRSGRFVFSGSAVRIETEIPEDLWPCDIDSVQIRQAIDNLLINARQAMAGGGQVQLTARNLDITEEGGLRPGRYVEVVIADDGPGMEPEIREQAFDAFFTTKSTGTGLGLATARSIVVKHKGSIELDSSPNRGTRFRILLPATTRKPVSDKPRVLETGTAMTARILVMDDDPTIREVTQSMLELSGHDVEVVSEGREAVSKMANSVQEMRPFDLAILDLTIPGGMGGKEAAEMLRPLHPELRVIASSGYSVGLEAGDSIAACFDAVLPKPYAMADLLSAVQATLSEPN